MFSLQRQTSERVSKSDAFNAKVSHPSRTVVYPKLEVTEPGDHDEQEADAVANDVMSGKICRQISHGSVGGGMSVSSQMEGHLNSLQGGGQVMPDGLRSMMERGFSRDFSQVRLHTDSEAASLSSSIHAKAFTHGNDIYFNQGQFSPNTSEGQKLMAHELTHVVQGSGKLGRDSIDEFLAGEKEWHDKNAVAVALDILSSIDSVLSAIIFRKDLKKIGILATKELSRLKQLKDSLPKHPVFDKIDIVSTLYSLCSRAIAIWRDIDMLTKGNKEYYAQLSLDITYLITDAVTFPPIEAKLLEFPYIVLVAEAFSAGLYIGDLINKIPKVTDFFANVVFPFLLD